MAEPATLALLAGGRGERMGLAKAWLEVGGRPVVAWLAGRWAWAGPTVLVTAPGRAGPPGAGAWGREAIDAVEGEGPLRGVLTALRAAETDVVVLATVDMPEVGGDALRWLAGRLAASAELGLMLRRRDGDGSRVEPFPCAMRVGAIPVVEAALAGGRGSVVALAREPGFGVEDVPAGWGEVLWTNLNCPADLARWVGGRDAGG